MLAGLSLLTNFVISTGFGLYWATHASSVSIGPSILICWFGALIFPVRLTCSPLRGGLLELKCGPELPIEEKYKHWGRASPWLMSGNPRDLIMPIDGDDGFFPTSGNEMKPEVVNSSRKYRLRVLVCAPSNSALDEIIFRLLKTGVRDENVRAYTPKIVRIGLKPHHSVEAVSQRCCEYLVLFSSSNSSLKGCNYQIGDPVQLPATVISPVAEKLGYGTSLFKRFQRAGYPVKMLKTQYRMHPEIRSFPSKEFYDEALEDGSDVQDQTTREWHKYRYFGPFCFFDIHEGKESQPSGSGSWVNTDEIEFVLAMYNKLITMYPALKLSICNYKPL
ncbi:probable helicase MAGATAMA 3 [Hibiscus syriacus]|uniref:probable helicase MAGATAMA 3 n=1 Tax=Hibiscus syriacus TaxID=106335 RepID=UPI001922B1C0|nr:probable helicase MAGATAMA 3 [Hibiscus syriacus]